MKRYIKYFLLLTVLCYFSCEQKTTHKVPETVLEKAFELKINRFDHDLFSLKKDTITKIKLANFYTRYPDFFNLFTKQILNIGDSTNPQMPILLKGFLLDQYINEMYETTQSQFKNLDSYNKELTEAFKAFHYFFPQSLIPEITYFVSGYNYANVTTTSTLGIGLEMYLGPNYTPYTLLEIPTYKQKLMRKEYIVSDALQAWISTELEKDDDYKLLLNQMLFKGKVIYTLEQMLPELNDTLKFGYSANQLQWCQNNEAKIWSHFIEKKLLFATLRGDTYKYINEGPFTAGFPRESPGKIGVWLGYQIIKKYAEQYPKLSLKQLFENHNAQQILTLSKYKPK
ncbi:MAG TPA: hypothetical protein PK323_00865 [Bacteroidia bacterium]|nr:hypothetical protein [Bacteroidia bacterium]